MPLSKAEGGQASYAKTAKLILRHIAFSAPPTLSSLETYLKEEMPKENDPTNKFPKLFNSYGGPYFTEIGPIDNVDPAKL